MRDQYYVIWIYFNFWIKWRWLQLACELKQSEIKQWFLFATSTKWRLFHNIFHFFAFDSLSVFLSLFLSWIFSFYFRLKQQQRKTSKYTQWRCSFFFSSIFFSSVLLFFSILLIVCCYWLNSVVHVFILFFFFCSFCSLLWVEITSSRKKKLMKMI